MTFLKSYLSHCQSEIYLTTRNPKPFDSPSLTYFCFTVNIPRPIAYILSATGVTTPSKVSVPPQTVMSREVAALWRSFLNRSLYLASP